MLDSHSHFPYSAIVGFLDGESIPNLDQTMASAIPDHRLVELPITWPRLIPLPSARTTPSWAPKSCSPVLGS